MKRSTEETIRCALFVTVIFGFMSLEAYLIAQVSFWAGILFCLILAIPIAKLLAKLLMGKRWTER